MSLVNQWQAEVYEIPLIVTISDYFAAWAIQWPLEQSHFELAASDGDAAD
jgi:hypothetical protein